MIGRFRSNSSRRLFIEKDGRSCPSSPLERQRSSGGSTSSTKSTSSTSSSTSSASSSSSPTTTCVSSSATFLSPSTPTSPCSPSSIGGKGSRHFLLSAITPSRSRKFYSDDSGRSLHLTSAESDALKQSWQRMPERNDRMAVFFYNFLNKMDHPIVEAFGLSSERISQPPTSEQMFADGLMSLHIRLFIQFMDELVDLLAKGETQRFVQSVRELGRRHNRKQSLTFTADKWLFFKNEFLAVVCGGRVDSKLPLARAWIKFFMFVVFEMKDAYNDGVRRGKSGAAAKMSLPPMMNIAMPTKEEEEIGDGCENNDDDEDDDDGDDDDDNDSIVAVVVVGMKCDDDDSNSNNNNNNNNNNSNKNNNKNSKMRSCRVRSCGASEVVRYATDQGIVLLGHSLDDHDIIRFIPENDVML